MFKNLIAEMARNNIKNYDLARELGVTERTISNKLNGKSEFTLAEINKIIKLFPKNTTFKYLFSTDPEDKERKVS